MYVMLFEMLFGVLYEKNVINICVYIVVHFHQADSKLREEEKRALRYLETRRDCNSVQAVSITHKYNGVFYWCIKLLYCNITVYYIML